LSQLGFLPFDSLTGVQIMATVRLRLPDDLQRRIEHLARAANQTPQAFMRDALTHECTTLKLTANEAAEAVGHTFALAASFDYLIARVSDDGARRPVSRQ